MMISIIVPIYNIEKYLDECVQSLVNQTYTDTEIILVDDGSTDTSGAKCDQWASKDKRIKAVHKPNGGLRSAIIKGCEESSGDYIFFVDGDDYIKPEAMEVLVNAAEKYGCDCVQFEYAYVKNGIEEHFTSNKFEILDGDSLRQQALYDWFKTGTNTSQWNRGRTTKFYSAQLVKSVLPYIDREISLCEDYEMSLWLLLNCKKYVSLEGQYLYCWRHVDSSMSKNVTMEYINRHLYFFDILEQFAVRNNIDHDALDFIVDEIWIQLIAGTLARRISFDNKHKFLKIIKANYRSKANIMKLSAGYAFLTRSSIRYIASAGCVVPTLLSQIYLAVKK